MSLIDNQPVARVTKPMLKALDSLQKRLAPAEEIFFTWLIRIFAVAILAGTAWIDDAPPLELAAVIISSYVGIRVLSQFGPLMVAAPFNNPVLKTLFALVALVLLSLAFPVIAIFSYQLALSAVG